MPTSAGFGGAPTPTRSTEPYWDPVNRIWRQGRGGSAIPQTPSPVPATTPPGPPLSGATTASQRGPVGSTYSVDPTGATTYTGTVGTMSEPDRMALEQGYQRAGEERRLGYLSQLQGQQPTSGAPTVQHGGADGSSARDAVFARAKDKAGQIARASLNALRNVMGERGLSGSSIEGLQQAGVVGAAGSELGDVNREQMIQDLNRQAEIEDLTYQGGVQQRGQDIAAMRQNSPESLLGLISARGLY